MPKVSNMRDDRWLDVFLWFSLGFCALVSQVVFQRECINVFSGNELSIGLVLFVWLLFGGAGSVTMGKAANRLSPDGRSRLRLWLLTGLGLLFPCTLIAIRLARVVLGIEPGEIAGLVPILGTTFVCLAPLSFVQGGLFGVYCSFLRDKSAEGRSRKASAVYSVEALGAVVGGVVLHFVLTGRVLPFATLVILSAITLVGACWQARPGGSPKSVWAALIVGAAILLMLSSSIEIWSSGFAFGGAKVIDVRETKYGRLVLARRFEQRSLFQNGLLLYSYPDSLSAEEAVHIPMLVHKRPKSVLLLGGGCGGSVRELLKHHPEKVDYVELDQAVIAVSKEFLPLVERRALTDPAVHIHYADARRFVATAQSEYDMVILNLPRPTNAQLNRFFTLEFFIVVRDRLAPGGIFAVQVPSAENYFSDEQKTFICSVRNTLARVFPKVALTPGQNAHLLASSSAELALKPDVLVARLAERQIKTQFVTDWGIPVTFEFFRLRMIDELLKGCPGSGARVNRDFSPVCYYYAQVLWSRESSGQVAAVYRWLGDRSKPEVYSVVVLLLAGVLLVQRASRSPRKVAVIVSLASIGFLEISTEMIVLIAYQIFFGRVYSMLGLLVCAYMAGIAVGALISRNRLRTKGQREPFSGLVILQAIAALFPFLVIAFLASVQVLGAATLVQTLFVMAILLSGVVGGALYIYGNAAYTNAVGHEVQTQTAGTTYFADLVGSAAGAIATTSFLLPVLGVFQSLLIASLVSLVGFVSLVLPSARRGS
ncbi:MAG TPA: fused MFS/spermidine synthase [bacterium]|nr:fused MFS/spermidine synthase [bacterium]